MVGPVPVTNHLQENRIEAPERSETRQTGTLQTANHTNQLVLGSGVLPNNPLTPEARGENNPHTSDPVVRSHEFSLVDNATTPMDKESAEDTSISLASEGWGSEGEREYHDVTDAPKSQADVSEKLDASPSLTPEDKHRAETSDQPSSSSTPSRPMVERRGDESVDVDTTERPRDADATPSVHTPSSTSAGVDEQPSHEAPPTPPQLGPPFMPGLAQSSFMVQQQANGNGNHTNGSHQAHAAATTRADSQPTGHVNPSTSVSNSGTVQNPTQTRPTEQSELPGDLPTNQPRRLATPGSHRAQGSLSLGAVSDGRPSQQTTATGLSATMAAKLAANPDIASIINKSVSDAELEVTLPGISKGLAEFNLVKVQDQHLPNPPTYSPAEVPSDRVDDYVVGAVSSPDGKGPIYLSPAIYYGFKRAKERGEAFIFGGRDLTKMDPKLVREMTEEQHKKITAGVRKAIKSAWAHVLATLTKPAAESAAATTTTSTPDGLSKAKEAVAEQTKEQIERAKADQKLEDEHYDAVHLARKKQDDELFSGKSQQEMEYELEESTKVQDVQVEHGNSSEAHMKRFMQDVYRIKSFRKKKTSMVSHHVDENYSLQSDRWRRINLK